MLGSIGGMLDEKFICEFLKGFGTYTVIFVTESYWQIDGIDSVWGYFTGKSDVQNLF